MAIVSNLSLQERVRRMIGVETLGPLSDSDLLVIAGAPPEYARAMWEAIVHSKHCAGVPDEYGAPRDAWIAKHPFCRIDAPSGLPTVSSFARRMGEGVAVSVTAMLFVWWLTKGR